MPNWTLIATDDSNPRFNSVYVTNSITASIFSGSHQGNGSGLTNILSASYAVSASWAPGGQSVTASYALTASYLDNANLYYVHTQSSNDVLWTINHNLGADYVNVTVWSGSEVVIPQRITRIDNNTIHVVFPVSESGYVVTSRGTFTQTNANLYYVHTQSSNDVLWTINHNLGADYVNVTVWSGSEVVIPQRITRIDNNTIHVVFPVSESGYVVTSRGTFTQTSVVSSSYALTSSFASGGSGSFMGNGSGLTGIISASYATSASYAPYTYISIGTTAPVTPSVNDLWIDTN